MNRLPPPGRSARLPGIVFLAAILSACAGATAIPIQGPQTDLAALTGEWRGTYISPDLSREGTIWFTLVNGADHAHGDVRMTPRGRTEPSRPYDEMNRRRHEPPQFLSIRFVQASSNHVDRRIAR